MGQSKINLSVIILDMILRIVTASGIKRIVIDKNQTLKELKMIIEDEFKIPVPDQKISKFPLHNPIFLKDNHKLHYYGLSNGSQIWLVLDKNLISKINKNNPLKKNQDYKIIRLNDEIFQKELKHFKASKRSPKHVPFNFWIANKKQEYKKQPWNVPNIKYDFRTIPLDKKKIGYQNLPLNAVLHRQQEYRHIDEILFQDIDLIKRFKISWLKNTETQRAALLFGTFEQVKKNIYIKGELKEVTIIRTHVHGIWEYPQKGVRATKSVSKMMKNKQKILESMGFHAVGMIITTKQRKDEKGDPIFMTGTELIQACKFQHFFKNV